MPAIKRGGRSKSFGKPRSPYGPARQIHRCGLLRDVLLFHRPFLALIIALGGGVHHQRDGAGGA